VALARHIQATAGNRALSRRLKVRGDVTGFADAVSNVAGVSVTPGTDDAVDVKPLKGTPKSATFRSLLTKIAADQANDAELFVGRHQPDVMLGRFPAQGKDAAGRFEQTIDLDDVEAMDRGAPGAGTAKLAHEIAENYEAHTSGNATFIHSHFGGGVPAEEAVLSDLGIGGRRRGERQYRNAAGDAVGRVTDFTTYLLVAEQSETPAGKNASGEDQFDYSYTNVRRVQPQIIDTGTVFGYTSGTSDLPAGALDVVRPLAEKCVDTQNCILRAHGIVDQGGTWDIAYARAHKLAMAAAAMMEAHNKPALRNDSAAGWMITSVTHEAPVKDATGSGRVDITLVAPP
jgi:hypothetical protein